MKLKYFIFSLIFLLTSCIYFDGNYYDVDVFPSLESFEIEEQRFDIEKYTSIQRNTLVFEAPLLDYSLSLNNQKHHISVSVSPYTNYNFVATFDNQIICNKYFYWFDNSNTIIDSRNNFVFFDSDRLTVLNSEYRTIYYRYFEELFVPDSHVLNAIYEIDNKIMLVSINRRKIVLLTLDSDYSVINSTYFKNETEKFNSNLDFFFSNSENEMTAYLDDETLIVHGYLVKLDYENLTSTIETDYNIISTPKLIDGDYIYKAIKITDSEMIYDPYHSFKNTSEFAQTLYDSNLSHLGYVFTRIKSDESADLFFVFPDNIAYSVTYLKLSTENTFTHHFFNAPVIFTGYTYHEDNYYYEFANSDVRSFHNDASESFTHFPI